MTPAFIGNQTEASYSPPALTNDTAYYWRIDEKNPFGITAGVLWMFRTETAPPTPPGELLVWDFAGEGGAASSTADIFSPSIATTAPSGVASIGPGLTPINYIGNGLTARNCTATTLAGALAGNDYFSWTITPKPGLSMTLTSLVVRPVSQNRERTFTVFSSVNGFSEGNEIGSFAAQANMNGAIQTIEMSGHMNLAESVEFRMYVHGYTDSYEAVGMGNGDVNDLVINGSTAVIVVPEPATFAEFADFAAEWMRTDCAAINNFCNEADIDINGNVGISDMKLWADTWLEGM
jgi:hypothetical protein